MSRLNNSILAQAMAVIGLGMLDDLMDPNHSAPFPLTSPEDDAAREAEFIARRKRHEAGRRAEAEKAQAAYDAKAAVFRDERAARKAANFAKRQPKR